MQREHDTLYRRSAISLIGRRDAILLLHGLGKRAADIALSYGRFRFQYREGAIDRAWLPIVSQPAIRTDRARRDAEMGHYAWARKILFA